MEGLSLPCRHDYGNRVMEQMYKLHKIKHFKYTYQAQHFQIPNNANSNIQGP